MSISIRNNIWSHGSLCVFSFICNFYLLLIVKYSPKLNSFLRMKTLTFVHHVGMDRKWMFANRLSDEYAAGVKEFVKFAVQNAKNPNSLLCPCLVCWHGIRVNPSELEDHLICKGIDKNYICWSNHGESRFDSSDAADSVRSASFGAEEDACDGDRVEEMAKAVEDDLRDCPQMFERLKNDAGTPLYNGCSKFTRLSAVFI